MPIHQGLCHGNLDAECMVGGSHYLRGLLHSVDFLLSEPCGAEAQFVHRNLTRLASLLPKAMCGTGLPANKAKTLPSAPAVALMASAMIALADLAKPARFCPNSH